MARNILFVHGAGEGAYDADAALVASLGVRLGPGYSIRYPRMPDEDSPDYQTWKQVIAAELADMGDGAILIGHSIGGSVIARAIVDGVGAVGLAAIVLVAAPFWHDDAVWQWPEAELPADAARRFPPGVPVLIYHGSDDGTVPVSHLDRYAKALPQAKLRRLAGRDHQLGNDLSEVAEDLERLG